MGISLIPNALTALQLESKILGQGVSDIVHFIGTGGQIVSWIDANGNPGGNLAINGGGGSGFGDVVAKTANYNIVSADATNILTFNGSSLTAALPAAAPGEPWSLTIVNLNASALIVSPNGLDLNGSTGTLSLGQNQCAFIWSDGLNYFYGAGLPGATGATGPAGPTGPQGPAGTGTAAWIDIQSYGAVPHKFAFNQPTAGATTVSGSPSVTIASGTLASALSNGMGVCIWAAGASTAQSTPSAPTITSPAVQGSQTLTYACVGYDSLGGLTAASSSGTVTNAPAIFGSLPVALSSISVTSNVCSVVFATAVNNSVAADMTIHITGVTGKTDLNGVWTTASFADTTHCTFNITSANGSGTITNAKGRVSNVQPITAISRAANGVVTVTTGSNHNFQVGTGIYPTEVIIEDCTPITLNGYYTIASASGSTFTYNTGVYSAVTGGLTTGSSIASVFEHTIIACPQFATHTIGYYIYSDSANPGGSLALIGKVPLGDCNFTDWGPTLATGYGAPAYVPTTAPVAAQAQMLSTIILSGGGTTSLVLNANAGQSIGALGATIMYDDGPNLVAAMAAAAGSTSLGGSVLLSPPTSNSDFSEYIFNSPINVPENINIIYGCGIIQNETWTYTAYNQLNSMFGSSFTNGPSVALQNTSQVIGLANPYLYFGENSGNTGGIVVDGLGFINTFNGQIGFIAATFFIQVRNCGFKCNQANANQGTSIHGLFLGSCTLSSMENIAWALGSRFYGNGVPGQSAFTTSRLPAFSFRASANTALPNYNDNTVQFAMRGINSAVGRGFTFDHIYSTANSNQNQISFGSKLWLQQGIIPLVTCIGNIFWGFDLTGFVNDTSFAPIFANLASPTSITMRDITITNCISAGSAGVVSGGPISNLTATGNGAQYVFQCQRILSVSFTSTSAQSDVVSIPGYSGAGQATLTPTNASAILDVASGLAGISLKSSGQVVVTHSFTAGMTFDITVTEGN